MKSFASSVRILTAIATAALCSTSAATTADNKSVFGQPISLKTPITLAEANEAQLKDGSSQEVLIQTEIKTVCQKKGCWMKVSDGKTEMRITFKDYGFFIPKDSGGRKVLAQGQIIEKEESVSDQKHYLKDAGADPALIEKVKTPKLTRSFVASGLQLL